MRRSAGVWIFIVVMGIVMWGYVSGVANKPSPRYVPVTPVIRPVSPTSTPTQPIASASATITPKKMPPHASSSAAVAP